MEVASWSSSASSDEDFFGLSLLSLSYVGIQHFVVIMNPTTSPLVCLTFRARNRSTERLLRTPDDSLLLRPRFSLAIVKATLALVR